MSRPAPEPIHVAQDDDNVFSFLFQDNMMITGTESGIIKEWNLKTFRPVSVLQKSGTSPILCLKSFGQSILSREKNGPIHLWEKHESGWSNSLLTDQCFGFSNIEVDETSDNVLIPSENAIVQIYSVRTHSKVAEFKNDNSLANILSLKIICLSGQLYLLSSHDNNELCLWDFRTLKIVNKLNCNVCVTALDFSADTLRGICGTVTNDVHVFSLDSSQKLSIKNTFQITNEGVNCCRIKPDNKIVALGCWDGRVRLFSWKSIHPLAVLDEFETSVFGISFVRNKALSKEGNYILVACGDKCIIFWDIYNS